MDSPPSPATQFSADLLLADELALHILIQRMATDTALAKHFITECDQQLQTMPHNAARQALQTIRNQASLGANENSKLA